MADTSAESCNANNTESVKSNAENEVQKTPRTGEDQVSSSGLIAPSRLGNPFSSKSPGSKGEGDSSDSNSSERNRSAPLLRPSAFNPSSSTDRSFGGSPFGGRLFGKSDDVSSSNAEKKSFILRPSALDKHTANFSFPAGSEAASTTDNPFKSSFKLEPAKMINPFAKKVTELDDTLSPPKLDPSKPGLNEEANNRLQEDKSEVSSSLFSNKESSKNTEDDDTSEAKPATVNGGGSFVFGQNLASRVVSAPSFNLSPEKQDEEKEASKAEEAQAAALPQTEKTDDKGSPSSSTAPTLEQSAAAEQAKLSKQPLQQVEVITGEEDESNVFHLNCKLFAFDKDTQSWLERGRGQLRLNDMSTDDDPNSFQSRLGKIHEHLTKGKVMRTTGNLRVVLNTKVWPEMTIERASSKSVRITAFDSDGTIKVFLIMTGNKDADQIYSAIDWRIQQLRLQPTKPSDSKPTAAHPELKRQRDIEDSDSTPKKQRLDGTDESTVDPETEVSSESFGSSTREFSSDA